MSDITLLDGRKVSNEIKNDLRRTIKKMPRKPRMGIISVENGEYNRNHSLSINSKIEICNEIGINLSLIKIPINELESSIRLFNNDSKIDGFIVEGDDNIIKNIDHKKDIDGFNMTNISNMILNLPTMIPSIPYGIFQLLSHYNIPIQDKNCVIIGPNGFCLPLSILIGRECNITTISNIDNIDNINYYTRNADIIIISVDIPNFIKEDMISEDTVIIDAGVNEVNNEIIGDVDFNNICEKSSYITPVPGGVEPISVVSIIKNLIHTTKINIDNENNI